jgi:hypothetical protein
VIYIRPYIAHPQYRVRLSNIKAYKDMRAILINPMMDVPADETGEHGVAGVIKRLNEVDFNGVLYFQQTIDNRHVHEKFTVGRGLIFRAKALVF